MKNKLAYFILALVSSITICFEIVSTRISSVIFVQNYAFIIISLAILGLGCGGIYSYLRLQTANEDQLRNILFKIILFLNISIAVYIISIILFSITNLYIYLILHFIPFFYTGIFFSQIFQYFAKFSFRVYAYDLLGAAIGAVLPLILLSFFTAPNVILFIIIVLLASLAILSKLSSRVKYGTCIFLVVLILVLIFNRNNEILGKVPIGNFPEKDFYHVYPNAERISNIEESRWSIYGRSDLIEYSNQDKVKQLFIDGAAGTQMYKFNGDRRNPNRSLMELINQHSTMIPFQLLDDKLKKDMLVIGPGGGKDILIGLLAGVKNITGVEVNKDFVEIVKDQKDFNGGIYTDFFDVNIKIAEGRHFIKQSELKYNIILMVLPSTEQLQNINNLASNENYLFTVEAIKDYLNILTHEGRMVFTVHNRWELVRLISTTMFAFKDLGINNEEALNHFIILGNEHSPTIVIRKNAFPQNEVDEIKSKLKNFPAGTSKITYLPNDWNSAANTVENQFLAAVKKRPNSLNSLIESSKSDISPVFDDKPFFYKVMRGIPDEYANLLYGILILCIVLIFVPFINIKQDRKDKYLRKKVGSLISLFTLIGIGFMILEISLFQRILFYLGSPTVSLSILLSSLLIGMGTGSYFIDKVSRLSLIKRVQFVSVLIIIGGAILSLALPFILDKLIVYNKIINSIVCFVILLPFGFLLGIPFPSGILLLKENKMEKYVPWMYGINGLTSVLGSIIAVILSMLIGFNLTFILGLVCYVMVLIVMIISNRKKIFI